MNPHDVAASYETLHVAAARLSAALPDQGLPDAVAAGLQELRTALASRPGDARPDGQRVDGSRDLLSAPGGQITLRSAVQQLAQGLAETPRRWAELDYQDHLIAVDPALRVAAQGLLSELAARTARAAPVGVIAGDNEPSRICRLVAERLRTSGASR